VPEIHISNNLYKMSFPCILSFGYFPGVRMSCADVSEPSVRSIFRGLMKNMNDEKGAWYYVCRVRDGRANGGGGHQVLGRSESISGCGGGGIKGACLVAARLLCVFSLSRFCFSVCRSGFQAVLRTRPSSLFILFGCICISIASLI
jgi:hypothetical protein